MTSAVLRIGEVARRAGVSPDTLRYYERLGLLPRAQRSAAGYRLYPERIVQRVALVRNAVRFGFSLREIAGFLRVRDGGGTPCRQVRDAGQALLERVDRQIAELVATRETMRVTLEAWDLQLARTRDSGPARLLEHLPVANHN
jgi:DNA-binding transcriptional MerR regulator